MGRSGSTSAALESVEDDLDEMVEHRLNGIDGRLCIRSLTRFASVDGPIPPLKLC